jgi:hypothetical protein
MFKTEQRLVEEIEQSFSKKSVIHQFLETKKNCHLLKEVNLGFGGYGIPDVVVVSIEKKSAQRNDFLSYFDISILNLIENNETLGVKDIVYITRSSEQKINNSLKVLLKNDWVSQKENRFYSHKKYESALHNSLAIEAKLKDWKRALNQAYRYKWFCKKSFVFLPQENIGPAEKNIDSFKRLGVGLASVEKKPNGSKINILYCPNYSEPVSKGMSRMLSEYVSYRTKLQ